MTSNKHRPPAVPLVQRFPALERVGRKLRQKRIPLVKADRDADVGVACLAMALGYFGRELSVEELRMSVRDGRDLRSAVTLLELAAMQHLRGRHLKIPTHEFAELPAAAMLQWSEGQWLVLDHVEEDGSAVVLDPLAGRRTLGADEIAKAFNGVALIFEQAEESPTVESRQGKRGGHLSRYLKKVLSEGGLLGRIMFVSLLLELVNFGPPLLVKQVSDLVIPRGDGELLVVLAAGILVLLMLQTLSGIVRSHLFIHLRALLSLRMSLGFAEHVMRLPYAFFQQHPAGDTMSRLDSNDTIRDMLTSSALSTVIDGILVIFALAFLFYESWRFALMVTVLALLQLLLLFVGRLRQKPLLAEGLEQQAREQSYEIEMFTGIETVKAMGCEGRALSRWAEYFIDVMNNGIAQGRLSAIIDAFSTVLGAISGAAPLLYGSYLALSGKLSLGSMLMVSSVSGTFLGSISKLCNTILSLQILDAYTTRLDEVFDTKPEQPADGPYPAPRLNGAITLQNVSFRYSELSPYVLRNVSLHIEPGKFVAVVGRSGAGKSTLAYLLLGLYPPSDGTVYLDGINLASLDLRTVRRQLGIVTQTHALFASTIRDNISMSDPSVPLEDVIRAAQLAQIHDDIVAMPLGYNTVLADRGYSLSGGQRQRLALARALVRQPAMLLLDEATSALDVGTERKVQIALSQLPCTRVVIAHRLSTVMAADVILVIENGVLAEAGRHDQLLAHGGIYAQLFMAQALAAQAVAG